MSVSIKPDGKRVPDGDQLRNVRCAALESGSARFSVRDGSCALVVHYPERRVVTALHTAVVLPVVSPTVILPLPEAAVGAAHKDVDLTRSR
jgi:hypothetical protein